MAQLYDANGNPFLTDVVQQAQNLGALAATNSVQLRGQAVASVQVTGIGALTLTFEGSTDGSNFDALLASPIAGGAPVSTTTANGHWVNINTAGLFTFRVRVSAYTSGSATVSVIASQGTPAPSYSTTGAERVDLVSENGTALGTPANFGTSPGAVAVLGVNSSAFVGTTAAVAASAGVQKVGISGATGTSLDGTTAGVVDTNLTRVANTVLGVPTNFGTTPGAVIAESANASLFVGTTAVTAAIAGAPDVNAKGWGGTALGTPTNFGTTPGAVVAGSVNSSTFIGTTVAVAASAGVQKVGISGATGTSLDGSSAGVLDINIKNIGNSGIVGAGAGVMRVGVVGSGGSGLDAAITAAAGPANGLAVLSVNNTTAPALTTGQSVAAQSDYQGSLFVKPYRRGQTKGQATTISATGATTIVTAQAAGIFADISNLVISVAPQATTASSFTATLSDGTVSYIFDLVAEVTVAAGTSIENIAFDPPLAATTAATAWTLNLSATNTVHVTVNFVLQKAS